MHAIVSKWVVLLMHAVHNSGDPTCRMHHLDIGFDELPELLCDGSGSLSERKRFRWVKVEEYASEEDGEDHVHFLLGIDSVRMVFRLQGKRKYVCSEVDVGEVANAIFSQHVNIGKAFRTHAPW